MTRSKAIMANLAAGVLALSMAGCGIEDMQKAKVQDDLAEASRQVSIGQNAVARQWVDRAVHADPGAVDTYVYTGSNGDSMTIDGLYNAVHDYKDAEFYDLQAAQKFPTDYHVFERLMGVQDLLGDKAGETQSAQKVITLLEAEVTKGKLSPDVYSDLGTAYWVVGNRQKALADFQKGISIYVTNADIYNSMAYAVAQANSQPDMAQALNAANTAMVKARQQNEDDLQISAMQDTLGWVEYRMGKYKQAEADMRAALEASPREPESLYHLGMIYLGEGDRDAARAQFKAALAVAPDYANAKIGLAEANSAPSTTTAAAVRPASTKQAGPQ